MNRSQGGPTTILTIGFLLAADRSLSSSEIVLLKKPANPASGEEWLTAVADLLPAS